MSLMSRLRFALSRRRVDEETRLELEAHLELLAEKYTRSGMTPDESSPSKPGATASCRRAVW